MAAHRREANRNVSYADVTGVEGNLFDGTATSKDILNNMRVLERLLLFQPGDRWCTPAAACLLFWPSSFLVCTFSASS